MRSSTKIWPTEAKVHLSLKTNTRWRLAHFLYPNSMFHGRRKQSVAVVSSKNPAAFLSLFKMEQEKLWKSSILRPPGWRWLEPSGFSSVISSQCLWRNQERILPWKHWVLCKSMVEFWSKLLDRHKINVKCWECQWLQAVIFFKLAAAERACCFLPSAGCYSSCIFALYVVASCTFAHYWYGSFVASCNNNEVPQTLKCLFVQAFLYCCQSAKHDGELQARSICAHLSVD